VKTKQIFAVSLDSPQKHRAAATLFDDTRLVITHCVPITGAPDIWRDKLKLEIAEKAQQGFAVIVEDRSGRFSPWASPFCFEDVEDERTMLQQALDWWFSLENSGNLILDPAVRRFAIRAGEEGGLIDIKHDDKGRVIYHPNWVAFGGGHKAMLLCVAAAMLENPLSERWIAAMLGALPSVTPVPPSPLSSWTAITRGVDTAAAKRIEQKYHDRQDRLRR